MCRLNARKFRCTKRSNNVCGKWRLERAVYEKIEHRKRKVVCVPCGVRKNRNSKEESGVCAVRCTKKSNIECGKWCVGRAMYERIEHRMRKVVCGPWGVRKNRTSCAESGVWTVRCTKKSNIERGKWCVSRAMYEKMEHGRRKVVCEPCGVRKNRTSNAESGV